MTEVASTTGSEREDADRQASLRPVTSAETVSLLAHYYRGEMGRMISWRDRIDRTSNWAIGAVAAMLSLSLSTPTAHHGVLLFAMVLVLLLLFIEARRYRYYDVYRDRVRIFERHYLAQVLASANGPAPDWASALAESLRQPQFTVSRIGAMTRRLRRNYGWLFLILLLAWVFKILSAGLQPEGAVVTWRAPLDNINISAAIGPLPGWAVLAAVVLFYAALGYLALQRDQGEDREAGEVHV